MEDWKSAWKGLPTPSPGACLPPEAIAAFVAGTRDEGVLAHLSACAACRADVAAARAGGDAPAPAALRLRLYRLAPGRRSLLPTLAVAAAVLVAIAVGLILFWPTEQSAPPMARPKSAPVPKVEPPPIPEPPSSAPERGGASEGKPSAPEPPRPAPRPEVPPAPTPAPAPAPQPPPPSSVPERRGASGSKPAPEKPAPEPTRVALKGSVFAIAGSCASQVEGETLQALRAGQKRDFAGTLRLKADSAAAKVAAGSVTCYLQRGGELSLLLEEGRTRVRLARGEAFFDVTPGKGPFVVETAHGVVTVNGTRFLVSAEKAETEVFLQKGAVDFTAADRSVTLAPGERSAAAAGRPPSAPQKADPAKRLAWLRGLEDTILIEADQMALQGGMTVLADPAASAGRAIGAKGPLKPGQEAVAEIAARRKQSAPYAVWIRLHWGHGVPSAATLSVGDALTWSSKNVAMSPAWQWVRVGTTELPEERFRVRLTDTQPGLRVDQILITSDPELNPEK